MANSYSWERPTIKIPKTTSEWIWDIIGYSFYIGSIIFMIIIWSKLPSDVPGHYDAAGEVDRWGSKWELLILPGIGFFILVVIQVLEKFPEVHNYPKRFNEDNARQFYFVSRKLINQVKNITLILFAIIQFSSISIALEWSDGFTMMSLPLGIIGLGVPIVIGLLRYRKIK